MTDPESTTQLRAADLAEVEVDEADAESRDAPLEADAADVAEQRHDLADGGDDPDERDR
ncbi:MAG TPA: hypothetical protein VGN18_00205 [Jatrophihabitans sp.]|jgi:hypothetical protein|uniref:hypothetical protein n=1 Tax=Jatrophihabitans sp. TaxID=1932789 RepID=UPI002E0C81B9|nr:hypothetical protein [Jatrophihabitans sp.]